jgi:actin-related protein
MVTYGGDEVNSIVIDVGGHTTKAGYAGDDTPKSVFTSYVGKTDTDYVTGDANLFLPKAGMDVLNPLSDGDSKYLTHALISC